jgi:methionyl-tRNA formyltransferase
VLLVGRGHTTASALEGLSSELHVCALVRDGEDEVTARAAALRVPVIADISMQSVRDTVARYDPDAVVVSSYNRILDEELVSRRPFVNVHYAPLPRGRGRATVNWAIINGDTSTAITIHHVVPELDAGGILFQQTVPIRPESTVTSLYAELNELLRANIAAATRAAIAGDPGAAQDESLATYCCTRIPEDGEIDWSATSVAIDRLIRALQPPFPSAYTWLGVERLHIERARLVDDPPIFEGRVPGRVVAIDRSGGSVDVLTGDGLLRVEQVRLGDSAPASAAMVVRSLRTTLGLRVADLVELIRTAGRP